MPHVPPPLVALVAGAAQHAVAPQRRPGPVRAVAAGGLAAVAFGLAGRAAREFRSRNTQLSTVDPSRTSVLVTTGPNRFTRNPMYVGLAALLTAHAVLRGGRLTLLPVAGFVAYLDRVQIPAEEAALHQRFGEEYAAYVAAVPRWLGPPR